MWAGSPEEASSCTTKTLADLTCPKILISLMTLKSNTTMRVTGMVPPRTRTMPTTTIYTWMILMTTNGRIMIVDQPIRNFHCKFI